MPFLRDQIAPDFFAGWAFLDDGELEALDRLVVGPIRGRADLALAESALRALLLHPKCGTLSEYYQPGAFARAVPSLIDSPEFPAVGFATDDPTIPEEVRWDLCAAPEMLFRYVSAQFPP